MSYDKFLSEKVVTHERGGFEVDSVSSHLFDFQDHIVKWALKMGKAAIFADCGLGKTVMQLEWANAIWKEEKKPILILAPLAVNSQTVEEGKKFGIRVTDVRDNESVVNGINIANYEIMHKFDCSRFVAIVLDESSILKSYTGKYRNELISNFTNTKYKLACTATPSPNDYMELGNHCEFLNIMSREEMLAMFFTHDSKNTSKWRIKKHAPDKFWEFVNSWAIMLRHPKDLGFNADGFDLPTMNVHNKIVKYNGSFDRSMLVNLPANTLAERRSARNSTLEQRVEKVKEIVDKCDDQVIIWCNFNNESELLARSIKGSVEIRGSDKPEYKSEIMNSFAKGETRILITKPKIAGFGMNWQRCNQMIFCGLSDSYEQYYQCTRRVWRFGQKREVDIYIVTSDIESAVLENIKRKQENHNEMTSVMIRASKSSLNFRKYKMKYKVNTHKTEEYTLHHGDSIELIKDIETESIDYSIFSPPFASLYVYSDSERDLGNSKDDKEFYTHFNFLISELLRVTKDGRLLSFHCMNLPMTKTRDGVIGIKDFRGKLIRMFTEAGWIYHSEVCIWKDPVVAMQRTKALGLLNKQKNKDSAMSRMGIADYIVTMRKPGVNKEPISHTNDEFPIPLWQKIASPIWTDIRQSNTIQFRNARDKNDEKHICPLQLDVIERCLLLWSNKGDLVFSPFMGIGSEGYQSVKMGRKFRGIELKESYYKQAIKNMKKLGVELSQETLI